MAARTGVHAGHEALGLSRENMLELYYYMILSRDLDERLWLLNRGGKIPFTISCQGQEAAQVGACYALDRSKDFVLPYYRDLGKVLVFGMTPREVMLSAYARAEDPSSGGKQMAHHWSKASQRIVSGSSPVSTQIPHTVGIALAARMRKEDTVALTSFGEGSSNQGDFHEALNFAGIHKLACIFHCQNNQYAISVPLAKQLACENVADRAVGYGMPGVVVDGNDVLAVYGAAKEAVARARRGDGPTLIESRCYRLVPHSSDDDDRSYRSREEVEEAKKRDPLLIMQRYMLDRGLVSAEEDRALRDRARAAVDDAQHCAEQAPSLPPEAALRDVYFEG